MDPEVRGSYITVEQSRHKRINTWNQLAIDSLVGYR